MKPVFKPPFLMLGFAPMSHKQHHNKAKSGPEKESRQQIGIGAAR